MLVLAEAAEDAVPACEPSPEPGTSMAMADPDLNVEPVLNVEPDPDADMTPLSPPTSEVEVHAPSDVTPETSAPARVEVGTSPVAFATPAPVHESQETPVQTEAVSLTTTTTQTLLQQGPEDLILLLPSN